MNLIIDAIYASWNLLRESSIYILFGLLVSGLLRTFLHPHSVARHLGIPIPL